MGSTKTASDCLELLKQNKDKLCIFHFMDKSYKGKDPKPHFYINIPTKYPFMILVMITRDKEERLRDRYNFKSVQNNKDFIGSFITCVPLSFLNEESFLECLRPIIDEVESIAENRIDDEEFFIKELTLDDEELLKEFFPKIVKALKNNPSLEGSSKRRVNEIKRLTD